MRHSWTCGKCKTSFPNFGNCGDECLGKKATMQLRRLVISMKEWNSHALKMSDKYSEYFGRSFLDVMGTLGNAYLHGVEEVFIVVEEFGDFRFERDIVFMKPSCELSLRRLLEEADAMFHEIDVCKDAKSWREADELLNKEMEFHRKRHEMVKQFQLNSEFQPPENMPRILIFCLVDVLTEEDIEGGRFPAMSYDLTEWKMPKFRFVEARKGKDLRFLSPGLEII